MGFFAEFDAQQLLRKLENEYRELCGRPNDLDLTFNFFVTANHIPDYHFPDSKVERANMRRSTAALAACEYVANEGKHSIVSNPKIVAVRHTELKGEAFQSGVFDSGAFQTGVPTITLKDFAEKELGPEITAIDLAGKVIAFWRARLAS